MQEISPPQSTKLLLQKCTETPIPNQTLQKLMLASANSNQPWNCTLPTLLLFPSCKTQTDVNQIHARMITTGLIKRYAFTTKLIHNFSSSPHAPLVEFARYVFFAEHAFQNPRNREDPFVWNAIIKTFSHGDGDPRKAVEMLCSMLETGVCVDEFSFSLVLKACARLGLVKEAMQVHALMKKFEFGCDVFLQNCLICLYTRCGCLEFGRLVFDRMPKRDSFSFNLMINGYVKQGMMCLARDLFDCMPMEMKNSVSWNSMIRGYLQSKDGFKVAWELFDQMPQRDLVSWNLMIDGCVKCGRIEIARKMFDKMPERDIVSWANMINGYAKSGSVDISRAFFDGMTKRDVISCNAMMGGYVHNGHCKEALKVFHDMLRNTNLPPNNATLLIALSAITQLGKIDEGVSIHCYALEKGFNLNGKFGVALINMYAKCGSIEKCIHVFEGIKHRRVDHYNAMIGGFSIHGLGELAFDLFMEMERLSIQPDEITFIGVLNACAHSGLLKEGLVCFEIMRRVHKLQPKLHHYGCVVDILGRAGHVEEAKRFIQEMPIEPNDVVWRTLLFACKNHENLKIGEPLAKYLINFDSYSSSSYVILSNLFASYGMWEYVRRVRRRMKERGLKKTPGCSWIEVEGTVHEFFAGDTFHRTELMCSSSSIEERYEVNLLSSLSCLKQNLISIHC